MDIQKTFFVGVISIACIVTGVVAVSNYFKLIEVTSRLSSAESALDGTRTDPSKSVEILKNIENSSQTIISILHGLQSELIAESSSDDMHANEAEERVSKTDPAHSEMQPVEGAISDEAQQALTQANNNYTAALTIHLERTYGGFIDALVRAGMSESDADVVSMILANAVESVENDYLQAYLAGEDMRAKADESLIELQSALIDDLNQEQILLLETHLLEYEAQLFGDAIDDSGFDGDTLGLVRARYMEGFSDRSNLVVGGIEFGEMFRTERRLDALVNARDSLRSSVEPYELQIIESAIKAQNRRLTILRVSSERRRFYDEALSGAAERR